MKVFVDELVEADFGVKVMPLYDIVTPGICAASSFCNEIVVGKVI